MPRTTPGRAPRALRAAALLLLSLPAIGAGGCAGRKWDYDKPGVTAITLDRDLRACRKIAYRPYSLSVWNRVDEDALNRCMAGRGYTVTPLD